MVEAEIQHLEQRLHALRSSPALMSGGGNAVPVVPSSYTYPGAGGPPWEPIADASDWMVPLKAAVKEVKDLHNNIVKLAKIERRTIREIA